MIINYYTNNMDKTPDLEELSEKKLDKLLKYFKEEIRADLHFRRRNQDYKVELTIYLPDGTILRSESETPDVYESLDRVVDKIERQIRKYKTKLLNKQRGGKESIRFENIAPLEEQEEDKPKVVRRKSFPFNVMLEEEAVLQMELLGHDFFIFRDGNSGEVNIIYKRRDGNYGLIEPEI